MTKHVGIPGPVEFAAGPLGGNMARDREEIPLSDLVRAFRRYAIALALVVVGCTAAALWVAYMVPKRYAATTTLSLVPQSSATDEGEIGSIASRLSAIASVSYNSDPKKVESLAKLQSMMLLRNFINENNLIPILFPHERVSLTDATEYFDKNIRKVISEPKSGFIDLTIRWKDPVLATTWANGLVAMINDVERNAALNQSRKTVAYLTDQANATDDVVTKRTLNLMIAAELRKSMVAQGTREFAFRVVDPAVVPEKYSYPNKMTWLITAGMGSFSISIFVLFCLVAWRKDADVTRPPGA